MQEFTTLIVISLDLFDFVCISYLKKCFISSVEEIVKKKKNWMTDKTKIICLSM